MDLTETEKLIQELNYSCASRLSDGGKPGYTSITYPSAIKKIASLFVRQVELGQKTQDEIMGFSDDLSLVGLLDNVNSYGDINQVYKDYNEWMETRIQHNDVSFDKSDESEKIGRAL